MAALARQAKASVGQLLESTVEFCGQRKQADNAASQVVLWALELANRNSKSDAAAGQMLGVGLSLMDALDKLASAAPGGAAPAAHQLAAAAPSSAAPAQRVAMPSANAAGNEAAGGPHAALLQLLGAAPAASGSSPTPAQLAAPPAPALFMPSHGSDGSDGAQNALEQGVPFTSYDHGDGAAGAAGAVHSGAPPQPHAQGGAGMREAPGLGGAQQHESMAGAGGVASGHTVAGTEATGVQTATGTSAEFGEQPGQLPDAAGTLANCTAAEPPAPVADVASMADNAPATAEQVAPALEREETVGHSQPDTVPAAVAQRTEASTSTAGALASMLLRVDIR